MPSRSKNLPEPTPPPSRIVWLVGGALIIALLVSVWIWRGKRDASQKPKASASAQDTSETQETQGPNARPAPQPRGLTPEQRQQQEEAMREMLRRAQQNAQNGEAPAGGGGGGPAPLAANEKPLDPLPKPGVLDDGGSPFNDYIKKRMQEDMMPRARECFDSAKVDNPGLTGRVVLSFRIVPAGPRGSVVQGARVVDDTSTLKDPELARCLAESAGSVRFGPPPEGYGETTLQYPLDFPLPDPDAGSEGK
jgi:hypothetical protein